MCEKKDACLYRSSENKEIASREHFPQITMRANLRLTLAVFLAG